jgi:hypothetical protein
MDHPNDDNGDVLRRLESDGDDLSRPRDVDFVVVFPDKPSADTFAENIRHFGYKVSIELSEVVAELPWDVEVVKHMALSHKEVTLFENLLENQASLFGGRNDGWDCLSERSPKKVN